MNPQDIKRLKVKRDVVIRYYVQDGDWIYAGPFDTKNEATEALKQAKQIDRQSPIL
jgi:hypothetical protein